MPNSHGDWIWYELITPDPDGAGQFYADVIGWTVGDQPGYREIETPEGHVGGMLTLSDDMAAHGARPGWVGYVKVDDVDAAVSGIEQDDGRVLMPPRDLAEAGRFAMVADPQGNAFYVMKPRPPVGEPDATSNAFAADHPIMGHCAWNELATPDPEAALRFYGSRFGWVKDGEMDMGPAGTYHFIRHGVVTGGVAGMMPGQPGGWTFYFRVPSIPQAVERIAAGGGEVMMGPHEIPGGDHIVIALDPQGARFAIVGGKG